MKSAERADDAGWGEYRHGFVRQGWNMTRENIAKSCDHGLQ